MGTPGPLGPVRVANPATPHAGPATLSGGGVTDERGAWAVLASVRGLGPVGFGMLLRRYGSGVAILNEAASPGGPVRLVASTGHEFGDDVAELLDADLGLLLSRRAG